MFRFALLLCLAIPALDAATFTAAWRIPGYNPKALPEIIRKLDAPPAESGFFRDGDELWDISRTLVIRTEHNDADPFAPGSDIPRPWQGDWVVWNARSGMIVAKAAWSDLFVAESRIGFDGIPLTIRLKLELEMGSPGADAGNEARSLSVLSSKGGETEVRMPGFEATVRPCGPRPEREAPVELGISCTWKPEADSPGWKIDTTTCLRDGVRMKIAGHGTGARKWSLFATSSLELPDGTPFREARFLEAEGKPLPWPEPETEGFAAFGRTGDLGIGATHLSSSGVRALSNNAQARNAPGIGTPAVFSSIMSDRLIDVRDLLTEFSPNFGQPEDFAGFHVPSQRLFVIGTADQMDIFGQLFTRAHATLPPLRVETNPEAGAWDLSVVSGARAGIRRLGDDHHKLHFEVEPTLGNNGEWIDLKASFSIAPQGTSDGQVDGTYLLQAGEPCAIATLQGPEGTETSIRVMATPGK